MHALSRMCTAPGVPVKLLVSLMNTVEPSLYPLVQQNFSSRRKLCYFMNNGILVESLGELVLVCVGIAVKRTMYQCKVDVDMLNTERAVGWCFERYPSLEQREGLMLKTSANILFTAFNISTSKWHWYIVYLSCFIGTESKVKCMSSQ